jgi:hypothetical protein
VFTLVKFITIMLATTTSNTHHCSCLGHLGRCDTDRIVSTSCRAAQGGQGKYCRAAQGDCRVSLSLMVLLTNVANVNDPLQSPWLLPFPVNITLGWEVLPGTNTLAYLFGKSSKKKKRCLPPSTVSSARLAVFQRSVFHLNMICVCVGWGVVGCGGVGVCVWVWVFACVCTTKACHGQTH